MIEVPNPSFSPEEVVLALEADDGSTIERQEAMPYYGRSVLNGRRLKDEATQGACKIYADWWLNSRVNSDDITDLMHINASNNYLIVAEVKKSYKHSKPNHHNDEDEIFKPKIYPDLYLFKTNYRGGIGYTITHIQDGNITMILPKDHKDEPREETIKAMKETGAKDLGTADMFTDPLSGHKLELGNAMTYISQLGALPIADLDENGGLA